MTHGSQSGGGSAESGFSNLLQYRLWLTLPGGAAVRTEKWISVEIGNDLQTRLFVIPAGTSISNPVDILAYFKINPGLLSGGAISKGEYIATSTPARRRDARAPLPLNLSVLSRRVTCRRHGTDDRLRFKIE